MTQTLDPQPEHKVLEIGTGSGYQAAVLSKLVKEVYTIEIVEPLAKTAAATLNRLGFANVRSKAGDGYLGWPTAMYFSNRGHEVTVVDNYFRRNACVELDVGMQDAA